MAEGEGWYLIGPGGDALPLAQPGCSWQETLGLEPAVASVRTSTEAFRISLDPVLPDNLVEQIASPPNTPDIVSVLDDQLGEALAPILRPYYVAHLVVHSRRGELSPVEMRASNLFLEEVRFVGGPGSEREPRELDLIYTDIRRFWDEYGLIDCRWNDPADAAVERESLPLVSVPTAAPPGREIPFVALRVGLESMFRTLLLRLPGQPRLVAFPRDLRAERPRVVALQARPKKVLKGLLDAYGLRFSFNKGDGTASVWKPGTGEVGERRDFSGRDNDLLHRPEVGGTGIGVWSGHMIAGRHDYSCRIRDAPNRIQVACNRTIHTVRVDHLQPVLVIEKANEATGGVDKVTLELTRETLEAEFGIPLSVPDETLLRIPFAGSAWPPDLESVEPKWRDLLKRQMFRLWRIPRELRRLMPILDRAERFSSGNRRPPVCLGFTYSRVEVQIRLPSQEEVVEGAQIRDEPVLPDQQSGLARALGEGEAAPSGAGPELPDGADQQGEPDAELLWRDRRSREQIELQNVQDRLAAIKKRIRELSDTSIQEKADAITKTIRQGNVTIKLADGTTAVIRSDGLRFITVSPSRTLIQVRNLSTGDTQTINRAVPAEGQTLGRRVTPEELEALGFGPAAELPEEAVRLAEEIKRMLISAGGSLLGVSDLRALDPEANLRDQLKQQQAALETRERTLMAALRPMLTLESSLQALTRRRQEVEEAAGGVIAERLREQEEVLKIELAQLLYRMVEEESLRPVTAYVLKNNPRDEIDFRVVDGDDGLIETQALPVWAGDPLAQSEGDTFAMPMPVALVFGTWNRADLAGRGDPGVDNTMPQADANGFVAIGVNALNAAEQPSRYALENGYLGPLRPGERKALIKFQQQTDGGARFTALRVYEDYPDETAVTVQAPDLKLLQGLDGFFENEQELIDAATNLVQERISTNTLVESGSIALAGPRHVNLNGRITALQIGQENEGGVWVTNTTVSFDRDERPLPGIRRPRPGDDQVTLRFGMSEESAR